MERTVTDLADAVANCRLCPRLVTWREKTAGEKRAAFKDEDYWGRAVPGFGDPRADVLAVGLAPGAHGANRTGRNFTGDPSGDFLYASLHRTGFANQPESVRPGDGLELTNLWITATVKCVPPENKPTAAERNRCVDTFLLDEWDLLQPRVVVALGGIAWQALTGSVMPVSPRPKFGHGTEVAFPDGTPLLGCYHPSPHNTYTGRLTPDMMDAVWTRAAQIAAR